MEEEQQQNVEANVVFQVISLSLSWLSTPDLCSVSTLNHEYLATARQNYLWQTTLSKLERIPLHHSEFYEDKDMCIPPRIRGQRHDNCSFLPHSRDHAAQEAPEPLVLADSSKWEEAIAVENGKIYDMFYWALDSKRVAREDTLSPEDQVWLQREFPIQCDACQGVALNNESEVFQHCKQWSHLSRALPEDKRIPPEFVDPRHNPEYANMTTFHKVRVMYEHRIRVLRALRAPMDEAGIAHMQELAEEARRNFISVYGGDDEFISEEEKEAALARCTPHRVRHVVVEKHAVEQFLEYGIGFEFERYSIVGVLRSGYAGFRRGLVDSRYGIFFSQVCSANYEVDYFM